MKKIVLSLIVIVGFLAYAVMQRTNPQKNSLNAQPSSPSSSSANNSGINPTSTTLPKYKDGTYIGDDADAFYGTIKVQINISGGKLTDVTFLNYPQDRQTSIQVNNMAMPQLKQEAIAAQNANVDVVSGATQTSNAFIQSLGTALNKAKS